MGRFTSTISKYAPVIESIMGNLNDIAVKNRYSDAIKSLQTFEAAKQEKDRFERLNRLRRGVNLTEKDQLGPMTDFNIDITSPQFQTSNTAKTYAGTIQPVKNEAGEDVMPPITPEGIKQYILQTPEAQKELAGMNLLQPVYSRLSDDKIEELRNKKAGLTPEDVAFYNEYAKKNYDTTAHNQRLQNIILDSYPGLISKGSVKDLFAKLYTQKAASLEIPGVLQPEYSFMNLNNGQVMRTDKAGNIELIDVNPKQKKNPLDNPEKWQVEERDGKYYWAYDDYNEKTGSSDLKIIRELSGTEKENYLREKETGDIKFNNLKNPKRSGTRGYRGGTKKSDPLDADLKTMSDIGLKNGKLPYAKWDKKDKEQYTESMNKIQGLTGKTAEEIWGMVGDWESKKYKTGVGITKEDLLNEKETDFEKGLTQQEKYDLNDEYNSIYDEINMDNWWADLYGNSTSEQDFQSRAKYYEKYLEKLMPQLDKTVGAKLWSVFQKSKGDIWNDLNNGGRFK